MPIRKEVLYIILAVIITFVVYYDSFNNSFIWDDFSFIVNNKAIRNLDIKGVISYFTDRDTSSNSKGLSADIYRPLVTTSFAIDYRLWGLNPRLYHIENTALHLFNVLLVFILAQLIFSSSEAAFIASLIFGIHPVQTEAVTWIAGRSNVLFLFFYLAALITHIKASRKSGFGFALILFTLGLFAKEMAITLPIVMLLCDLRFSRRQGIGEYIEYYTPFFTVLLFYLAARWSVSGGLAQGTEYWGSTLSENSMVMLKAIAGYMRLLILPINLRADYVINIPESLFSQDMAIAFGAMAVVAGAYASLRRDRPASFFILWFFVTLAPVYNIVPFKAIMAERFLYPASIGFSCLAALILTRLRAVAPKTAVVSLCGLIIFYGAGTLARNVDWRNEIYLYTQDLVKSPESARFHYNLGFAYCREHLVGPFKEKDPKKRLEYYAHAEDEFRATLRLRPDHADSHFYLGNVYSDLGLYDKAIGCFKKALSLEPNAGIYNNLGIVYYNRGEYNKAIECYKNALALNWDTPQLGYLNLGNAYLKKKEFAKARRIWEAVLKLDPTNQAIEANIKDLKKAGF